MQYKRLKEKTCCARHFDLLHNSTPTVPMYADGVELFVFGASLTSASLSKKLFDKLGNIYKAKEPVFPPEKFLKKCHLLGQPRHIYSKSQKYVR